jgi:hypothetical protein
MDTDRSDMLNRQRGKLEKKYLSPEKGKPQPLDSSDSAPEPPKPQRELIENTKNL